MGQYIRIPGGRSVKLGEYVRSWKVLLTVEEDAHVQHWGMFGAKAGEVLQEMRAAIHDRINAKDATQVKGRRTTDSYSRALAQFNMYVVNPRVIIDFIDPILGKRVLEIYGRRLRKNLLD